MNTIQLCIELEAIEADQVANETLYVKQIWACEVGRDLIRATMDDLPDNEATDAERDGLRYMIIRATQDKRRAERQLEVAYNQITPCTY